MITSGCAALQPWASAVGGIVGGLIYLPSSLFVLHVLKIDDPVDAFVVRPSTIHGKTRLLLLEPGIDGCPTSSNPEAMVPVLCIPLFPRALLLAS